MYTYCILQYRARRRRIFLGFGAHFQQSGKYNYMSRGQYTVPATGENFEESRFLIKFGILFHQSGNG
jgi:hypothetical protein